LPVPAPPSVLDDRRHQLFQDPRTLPLPVMTGSS
jgi:hypothetical protein